jgi:hypothetical protein
MKRGVSKAKAFKDNTTREREVEWNIHSCRGGKVRK